MDLKEPKKKRRAKSQPQAPLPITIDGKGDWVTYTAHLSDLGTCIVDPNEMYAVHSMGFFGKGSLSRGFPTFGKAKYGAPPVIKNRQWVRRQEWMTKLKKWEESLPDQELNAMENMEDCTEDTEDTKLVDKNSNSSLKESTEEQGTSKEPEKVSEDIIEVSAKNVPMEKALNNKTDTNNTSDSMDVDEVILDSTEDEDCAPLDKEGETVEVESILSNGRDNSDDLSMNDVTIEILNEANNFQFHDKDSVLLDENVSLQHQALVLPDSDGEMKDYLTKIKPRIENEGFPIRESLHLTFEETFFLMFGLGCLNVLKFDGTFFAIKEAWNYFCKEDKQFVQKYVVYHYFRSKGWVVKPGLKYGGDFLLYKQGPSFYHASYIVIIDVMDADTLIRIPEKSMRKLKWNNLFGLERLSETAAKEILFAEVLWPSSISRESNPTTPEVLSEFTIREVLWRRWNPKQGRDVVDLDEEDEDSC